MNTLLVKHNADGWLVAPWAGGLGGSYEASDDPAWLDAVAADALGADPVPQGDAFFIGLTEDGMVSELLPLSVANKQLQQGTLTATDPTQGDQCSVDEKLVGTWLQSLTSGLYKALSEDRRARAPRAWLQSLANGPTRLAVVARDGHSILAWLEDGGREGWLAERERGERHQLETAQRTEAKRKLDSGDAFINPYSFVPLPQEITRSAPRGHHDGAAGLSGWFDWELTLQTDLLLPQGVSASDEVLSYPGSALRGALRSLHETVAGGCMRVLDESYVPVHREPMNAYHDGSDLLAVVREIDPMTHAVTKVEVVDRVYWVPIQVLQAGLGALYSGMTLRLDTSTAAPVPVKNRWEVAAPGSATPGSDYVMHITAAGARRPNHTYYVAVGRLSGRNTAITDSTWQQFITACEGSQDLVGATAMGDTSGEVPGAGDWPAADVRYDGTYIGKRRRTDGWLGVGDTVWLTGGTRTRPRELKMATIWRSRGDLDLPVSKRMPTDLLPCSSPTHLCPTCAVFGSIRADRSDDHEQAAYRTHINVGWARSVTVDGTDAAVSSETRGLPPLRSPKPSSGGFYLDAPTARYRRASTAKDHVPQFHWRNQPDESGQPRRIRGRKYYWHGQADGGRQTPRNHNTDQHGEAQSVDAGVILRARITFDNLDAEQLGWLLVAAQPDQLFGETCHIHLGGGKPLGYGTAAPRIENLVLFEPAERYGGATTTTVTRAQAIEQVAGLVTVRGLTETHRALARLLRPDAVDADRISYPTSEPFSRQATKAFAESFGWFGKHSGGRIGDLVPLPEASNLDQYLDSGDGAP